MKSSWKIPACTALLDGYALVRPAANDACDNRRVRGPQEWHKIVEKLTDDSVTLIDAVDERSRGSPTRVPGAI